MKMFGNTPVPWTISWAGEEQFFVDRCPYAGQPAIRQAEAWGAGKPKFGAPHSDRQRRAIALMLCDLCEQPLKTRTKVSLSHARPVPHSARGMEILQVEPLVCRPCARICAEHCPSLRRDIARGTLNIRQVFRSDVQFAVMSPEFVETVTGERTKAVGHAKVHLIKWRDRDPEWIGLDKVVGPAGVGSPVQ